MDHDSGLVICSNILHWFHILLVLNAYLGMFMCISRCISTFSGALGLEALKRNYKKIHATASTKMVKLS